MRCQLRPHQLTHECAVAGEKKLRTEQIGDVVLPMQSAPSAYIRRDSLKKVKLPERFDARHLKRGTDGRVSLSRDNSSVDGPLAVVCSPSAVVQSLLEAIAFSADVQLRTKYFHFGGRSNHMVIVFTGDAFRPCQRGNKRSTTATRFSFINYGADIFRSDRWVELCLAACKEESPFMGLERARALCAVWTLTVTVTAPLRLLLQNCASTSLSRSSPSS